MKDCVDQEVAKLFYQLPGFSRLHLAEVRSWADKIDLTLTLPKEYGWPDHATAERTPLLAGGPAMSRVDALRAALQGERRGYEFFVAVAAKSPELAALAKESVKEEAEHVSILEAWITREKWANKYAITKENV